MGGCKKLLALVSLFFSLWPLCAVLSRSVVSDSLRPHGLWPARLLCSWDFPGRSTGVGAIPSSRGSSQPRDRAQVSHIADGFFTIWATREAQEGIGVGTLALLQKIFLTQELNQGFLHCGWILHQLSYQGTPFWPHWEALGILVAWPGIEPMLPAESLNLWDAREVPILVILNGFTCALISSFF